MKKSYLLKIIKEEITNAIAEDANADKAARDAQKVAIQKQMVALQKKLADLAKGGNMNENELEEDQLNEMAKIAGDLEAAIKRVIDDNPETEGLALKKLIRADEDVLDALEGDDLYDNQLNRFISLYKGERTLSPRGRKGAERVETLGNKVDKMSPEDKAKIEAFIATLGDEDQLNEMAKISGKLESAIRKVIVNNHELEGLALKKKIKADDGVIDALAGDDLYDNQLNKFIALVRGQRELGKKGRKPSEKADEPKKEEPKAKKEAPKKETPKKEAPKKEAPKKEKKAGGENLEDDDMEDEEKIEKKAQAAAKKGGSNLTKLNRAISQVKELEKEMKEIANDYKKAEGKEKENLLNKLKEKTKEKKELEKLHDKLAADVV
jgi:hypothetical protein